MKKLHPFVPIGLVALLINFSLHCCVMFGKLFPPKHHYFVVIYAIAMVMTVIGLVFSIKSSKIKL